MKKLLIFISLLFLLSGCAQASAESVEATPPSAASTETEERVVTPESDMVLDGIRFSLSTSPHAAQYDCEDCHAGASAGDYKELAVYNQSTGQVEAAATASELCETCHVNRHENKIIQGDATAAHANLGCADCHNVHSAQASCTQSGCHAEVANTLFAQVEQPAIHPTSGDTNAHMCEGSGCHALAEQVASAPVYHRPIHVDVPCYVCHDGSGLAVAQNAEQAWISVAEPKGSDADAQQPVVSHWMVREVDCSKCHYAGNPWDLTEVTENPPNS